MQLSQWVEIVVVVVKMVAAAEVEHKKHFAAAEEHKKHFAAAEEHKKHAVAVAVEEHK